VTDVRAIRIDKPTDNPYAIFGENMASLKLGRVIAAF
jgi:hypothetical protein